MVTATDAVSFGSHSSYTVVVLGFSPWYWTLTDTIKETCQAFANDGYKVFFVNCHLGPRSLSVYQKMSNGKKSKVHVIRQRGDVLPYFFYKVLNIPKLTGDRLAEQLSGDGPVILYRCTSSPSAWEVEQLLVERLRSKIVLDVVEVLDYGLPLPQHLGIPQMVTAVNKEIAGDVSAGIGNTVRVLGQGVSNAWFHVSVKSRPRVAGHFGNLGRLDIPLLVSSAKLMPNWTIRLVGPGFDGLDPTAQALIRQCPNIEVWAPVHQDDLLRIAEDVSVWWILFSDTEFNRMSNPLKLAQSLASGRPVVATMMPWAVANPYVHVISTPEDCVIVTVKLHDNWTNEDSQSQRESVARDTWSERARRIVDMCTNAISVFSF